MKKVALSLLIFSLNQAVTKEEFSEKKFLIEFLDDEEKAQALKELRQMANELAKAGQLKPDLLLDEDQNIVSGLEDIYFSFEGLDLSEEQFQGECPVCLTSTSSKPFVDACGKGHYIHKKCAADWKGRRCVLCREKIPTKNLEEIGIKTKLLLEAARQGDEEGILESLSDGVEVDASEKNGDTALVLASMKNRPNVVRLLIQNGANVNHANSIGRTSLMAASFANNPEIVKILIQNGADVNAVSNSAETALKLTLPGPSDEVIEILKAAGAEK